jgi:DNA mismatch repair ATPase MutS
MITDKTTRNDLNLFSQDGRPSIFSVLDHTTTTQGSAALADIFARPLSSRIEIEEIQKCVHTLMDVIEDWPNKISNGTVMVVEKFLETAFTPIPENPGKLESNIYRMVNPSDYSLLSYSLIHCVDLILGLKETMKLFENKALPEPLKKQLDAIKKNLPENFIIELNDATTLKKAGPQKILKLCRYLRFNHRNQVRTLIQIHSKLDAWMSMAKAMRKFDLTFPEFIDSDQPLIHVNGMGHLLLEKPVRYDISLNHDHHFLFLTGANMAGKSTFIKSLGTAVYLAHLGMGVPCRAMKLSLFDGILTNINIQDDITKGESYFYQEVKRIKATVETVNDGKKWLILIDELFKGTNITDAMNCSLQVIQGLLRRKNAVYVLSTHLYEISDSLKNEKGILFRYFETSIHDNEYEFSYQLREGVSQDKLGMLILKKEGVLELLKK